MKTQDLLRAEMVEPYAHVLKVSSRLVAAGKDWQPNSFTIGSVQLKLEASCVGCHENVFDFPS